MVTELLNLRNSQSLVSVRPSVNQSVSQSVTIISARDASASEKKYFFLLQNCQEYKQCKREGCKSGSQKREVRVFFI